ncbi:MAG: dihydrolipoamide acetyltransferase family protein [Acidobacteria bacterium]|nr:dihydrolipoamide acetyltransferase family protein [Acidobacteriota bacterium]
MASDVLMPQLGESIAEGTIVRWNKRVGDRVDRDEPLFEVSTDKVDAEVPSPAGGVLAEVRAEAGETVPVDSVVAIIGAPGEIVVKSGGAPAPGPSAAAPEAAGRAPASPPSPERRRTVHVSPVVRRLAREHGVDPAAIAGTGAGGRVTKDDILKLVASTSPTAAAPAGPEGDRRIEPLSVMRRGIAEHMLRSRRTSAHVHTVFDVDFSRVASLREAHRESYAQRGVPLTFLSFVAKAVVDALVEMPVLNASLTSDGAGVVHAPDLNLGIAVALDDDGGLIVPVIRRASEKSVPELAAAIADVATRARSKRLAPEEAQGGTFTITNPGAFGSLFGMPIINQPQVAILCLGAVERRPVVIDDAGTIAARPRAYLTLGFDHRLIDGAVADRFMARLKSGLEQFDSGVL